MLFPEVYDMTKINDEKVGDTYYEIVFLSRI